MGIPPVPILVLYLMVAIAPLLILLIKKDLVNSMLLWFFLLLFEKFGVVSIPLIPDISPQRIIWTLIFLFFFFEILVQKRKIIPGSKKVEIAMLLFSMLVIFSMINAGTYFQAGRGLTLSIFLSGYFLPFSMFFLAKNTVDDMRKVKKIFALFAVIGCYLGITGIFEYFYIDYLVFPSYIMNAAMGIHWGRARGPFLQAAVNGAVIGIIFFMALYLILQRHKKWTGFLLISGITAMLTTILLTFTRSCWVAFLLSLFVVPMFFPKFRIVFIISIVWLVIFVGAFTQYKFDLQPSLARSTALTGDVGLEERVLERTTSIRPIESRINIYVAIWRMFLEKPLLGFGFDTFKDVGPDYFTKIEGVEYFELATPHDTWSGILAELGLVGLSIFTFIMFSILKDSIRFYQRLPKMMMSAEKVLIIMFWGMCIVFFVNIQFIQMNFFTFPNALFFMMSGIIVGMYQRFDLNNFRIGEAALKQELFQS